MNNLLERIGLPLLVQISIECWNELLLLLLIFVMVLSTRRDRSGGEETGSSVAPLMKELVFFYSGTFVYNLCDIAYIVFSGMPTMASFLIMRISSFLYYCSGEFLTLIYLQVVKKFISDIPGKTNLKKFISFFQYVQLPIILLLLITPFTGAVYRINENNEYVRSWGYYIWQTVTVITFAMIGIAVIVKWRRIKVFIRKVICIASLFIVTGIVCGHFTGISMTNIMVVLISILLFLFYEECKTRAIARNIKRLEQTKARLAESRLTMMTAQIKPHYIYNSMNVIRELCYSDPELAAETIAHFSGYLHGKIEAFSGNGLTTFEKEIDLVKEYIAIEYADDNKKFKVDFDLKCTDFKIPALTVQPLVENAVKHGIDRYSDKSLVCISSFEKDDNIVIAVTDNATAEEGNDSLFAEKRGIGLTNVAERLKLMCGGKLQISHDETGTSARIVIPMG